MGMSGRLLRPLASGHPDALSWRSRVIANGGTVSASTMTAVTAFCKSIDSAGIRGRFYRLNLFAGDALLAALVPLYRGPSFSGAQLGNTTDTNVNFVSSDYAENQGISSATSGKVLNTGLQTNALPTDGGHLAWSVRNNSFVALGFLLGVGSSGTYRSYCYQSNANTQSITVSSGSAVESSVSTLSAYARWVGSRTSASLKTIYRNGISTATNTTAITATAGNTNQLSIFGQNAIAGAQLGLHYYSIGDSLTASQVSSFDSALAAFLTAMGRS